MFRPRSLHRGYAGARFARLLAFVLPMLLACGLLLRAAFPLPEALRWLWIAFTILGTLSGAVALILLLFGPWQNRLAGLWLGLVVGVLFYLRAPAESWAAQFSRLF